MSMTSKREPMRFEDAPQIPGLSFRRFRGESDIVALADIIQRSKDADMYTVLDTPEDIANDFRHLLNCDPGNDMFLVEIDGTAVGFARCQWHDRPGGVRSYEHFEHLVPEWRGKGLRHLMLRENERRLREIAQGHPAGLAKYFEVRTSSLENDWRSLLEEVGYRPYRYHLWMVRPSLEEVPDIPLPAGLEVRPVRPDHYNAIFGAMKEAFRDEPNFSEEFWTEEGVKGFTESPEFRPEIWQVAWDGEEVAGAVINSIYPEENAKFSRNWGWTGAIFVRRSYRGRGLAKALIARSFEVLKREGMTEAALMVDSENPSGAGHLYERMGFRIHTEYTVYRKLLD